LFDKGDKKNDLTGRENARATGSVVNLPLILSRVKSQTTLIGIRALLHWETLFLDMLETYVPEAIMKQKLEQLNVC